MARTPKLKLLPPRIQTLAPRIGRMPGEKARDKDREANQPWRKWYHSKEWQVLRLAAFKRDRYICQRSGEVCFGKGNEPNAPVANHKTPHKGDRSLFFDLSNIETVTKKVHDSLVQREEKSGRIAGTKANGSPIDPGHHWNR